MRGKPELIQLVDKAGNLKSPYWYIRYYDGRSQRVSTGCLIGTQDHEANLALAAFTLERERPTAREPNALLIAQALKDYYDEHVKYLPSEEPARYSEVRLKAYFMGQFASQITPSRIADYVRDCQGKGYSNGTIRRDLQHLGAALNHEVREQRLIYAPKFKLPPPPAPRAKYLTKAEEKKLLAACHAPHIKAFVQIMLNTGQRPNAVESLTWFQVDFKSRIIHFDRNGKSQTNKRVRPVPMNDDLYALLKALHKERKTEFVLEFKGEQAGSLKNAIKRAAKRAGLKDVTRYTLRKTFSNRLDEMETDDKTISELMGHTSTRTTNTHYISGKMKKLRKAVDKLGSAQNVRKRKKQ